MEILTIREMLLLALAVTTLPAAVSIGFTTQRGLRRARLAAHAADLLRRYLCLAREVRRPIPEIPRHPTPRRRRVRRGAEKPKPAFHAALIQPGTRDDTLVPFGDRTHFYDGVTAVKTPIPTTPEASTTSGPMLVLGTALIVLIPLLAGLL